jgi:tRNA (cytidine/uridine-2'-O-)-methyltransferase
VPLTRHASWDAFDRSRSGRIVLLSTAAAMSYIEFPFAPTDILLLGRESAGVPDIVHERADARIRVPMIPGARSLNVALAAAMVLSEALRKTKSFPSN